MIFSVVKGRCYFNLSLVSQSNGERNVIEEMKNAEASGRFTYVPPLDDDAEAAGGYGAKSAQPPQPPPKRQESSEDEDFLDAADEEKPVVRVDAQPPAQQQVPAFVPSVPPPVAVPSQPAPAEPARGHQIDDELDLEIENLDIEDNGDEVHTVLHTSRILIPTHFS